MGCKVHDRVRARENFCERAFVEDVSLHQFETRRQQLVPGAEIVKNNDFVAGTLQGPCGMTSDVSSAADD